MNIKFSSITFLVAAIASISFSQQAAHAGGSNARFDYAPNTYALDAPTGRHGGSRYAGAHNVLPSVAAGAVPKNNLLNSDFVSKPAPPPQPPAPVVAAAPIARPSVSAQVKAPSMFNSLFNPVNAIAAAPPQAGNFGSPIKPAALPKAPEPRRTTNTSIAWTKPHHVQPTALAAAPPIKLPTVMHQTSGFNLANGLPLSTNTGSGATTSLKGTVIRK